jgi:hypothetical protein
MMCSKTRNIYNNSVRIYERKINLTELDRDEKVTLQRLSKQQGVKFGSDSSGSG